MSSPYSASQRRPPESIRNPRRRRRNDSETLRQQPRKRSKISDDTFKPRSDDHANGIIGANGHTNGDESSRLFHLPTREKRHASSSYRSSKSDGSTTLSKTEEYIVKQLPALPERLRTDATGYRAFFQSSATSHHVIATTREAALLWDYNSSTSTPVSRVLNLPQPLKHSDPLPLASLAITGTSSDVGIVIVHPNTGKILFRENLDSADSLSLFQRNRQGVEGTFKLMSGETVVDMIDVKDAGYILILSSGRLAHLRVRDQQGRPLIAVSQMNSDGQTKGSWFGSFSQILGGGWRNAIAAVNTRPSWGSGQMEVVAVTVEGSFKLWNVSHDGQNMFKTQIDASDEIRFGLVTGDLVPATSKAQITVLDFAILQGAGNSVAQQGGPAGMNIIVLVAFEDLPVTRYALLYMTLAGDKPILTRITPIVVFSTPAREASNNMRLLIPQPEHTAFLVASNAVVVASIIDVGKAEPFQDIIYFHDDKGADILSSSVEIARAPSRTDASSILLFTQVYGAVRIVAGPCSKHPDKQKVSAKSKIEQAVFFGSIPNNILNLGDTSGFAFSSREVETAAVQISQEILQSTTEFIRPVSSTMDTQITLRIKALHHLIVYMRQNYSPLSRKAKWLLMLDAERMASALALWHVSEKWLEKKGEQNFMLPVYIEAIHERNKKGLNESKGENDPIREWLTKDMNRIEKLFTLIPQVHKEQHTDNKSQLELPDLVDHILEAYDIFEAGLQTSFDFRERNASVYGLEDEPLENGVLRSGYEDLPEMWTARMNTVTSISKSARAFGNTTATLRALLGTKGGPDKNQVEKLSKAYPKLVMLSCLTHIERGRWLLAQDTEEEIASGERIQHQFNSEIRPQQLLATAEVGQAFMGMDIAEKIHDMKSLVELILNELEFGPSDVDIMRLDLKGRNKAAKYLKELHEKVEGYFKKFGEEFAYEFFTARIHNRQLADLLEKDFGKGQQLTKFLRSDPAYWKLCWLNDVTAEKDLLHAGKALMAVAKDKEMNIWAKQAELSVARLSILASKSTSIPLQNGRLISAIGSSDRNESVERFADDLLEKNRSEREIAKVQEELYNHLKDTFRNGVNDDELRINGVMDVFGKQAIKGRISFQALLRQGFERLYTQEVLQPHELIDILTLMDSVRSSNEDDGTTSESSNDIAGQEFLMALRVLDASGLCDSIKDEEQQRGETMVKLIWKRLFIRDDWTSVNETKGKSDKDSKKKLKNTLLYATLKDGLSDTLWVGSAYSARSNAYSIPTPTEVIGAGSSPNDLLWQYPNDDSSKINADLRKGIAADNAKDDEKLSRYLSAVRMGSHYESARELASEEIDREYDLRARLEEEARAFALEYKEKEREHRGLVERGYVLEVPEDYGVEDGLFDDDDEEGSFQSSPRKERRRRVLRGVSESLEGSSVADGEEDESMGDMESYGYGQGYDEEETEEE